MAHRVQASGTRPNGLVVGGQSEINDLTQTCASDSLRGWVVPRETGFRTLLCGRSCVRSCKPQAAGTTLVKRSVTPFSLLRDKRSSLIAWSPLKQGYAELGQAGHEITDPDGFTNEIAASVCNSLCIGMDQPCKDLILRHFGLIDGE